jgi:hypothetical protein
MGKGSLYLRPLLLVQQKRTLACCAYKPVVLHLSCRLHPTDRQGQLADCSLYLRPLLLAQRCSRRDRLTDCSAHKPAVLLFFADFIPQ